LQYIDFSGNLDSKGNPIELKKADFIQTSTGRFRLKKYPALDTVNPQKEPFKGKVYVLIDGWVASEGASLASLIHHAKRGTFIGEETGGAYNGTTGGILGNTYLPHSNLRITIPVFKIVRFTGKENEGKGIRPHVVVETKIEELLAGKDPQLAHALKLIGKK
jgi:C-terminal processing protease CtpA/Prc